jgi:hypothetical protein
MLMQSLFALPMLTSKSPRDLTRYNPRATIWSIILYLSIAFEILQNNYANVDLIVSIAEAEKVDGKSVSIHFKLCD